MKRHEIKGDTVVLYFDQISSHSDVCVSLVAQHVFMVNDAKDANVKIYDYYQPEHSKTVAYNLPSSKSNSLKFNQNKTHSWNTTDVFTEKKNSINKYFSVARLFFVQRKPTAATFFGGCWFYDTSLSYAPTSSDIISVVI